MVESRFSTGTSRVDLGDELSIEDSKEVFANFGLAIHVSNVLENAILNACFIKETFPRIREFKSRDDWEKNYDAYFAQGYSLSFGNLIKLSERVGVFSEEMLETLRTCKRVRDNLAHHFMRDSAGAIYSESGRRDMIEQCMSAMHLFEITEKEVGDLTDKMLANEGVDLEHWDAKVSQAMTELVESGKPI